jgi:hypothetical protein
VPVIARTLTSTLVLPLAAALGLLSGSSAGATDHAPGADTPGTAFALSQCVAGAFCVWSGTSGTGTFTSTTSTSWRDLGISPVLSVWNRSSNAARIASGSAGTGTSVCYAPGDYVASTSVDAGSFRLLLGTAC